MPDTHDIGRFYWHTLRSPGRPAAWAGRAWTEEVEAPFRRGTGWAFRVGRRSLLIVGLWHQMTRDEDEALLAALGASSLDVDVKVIKEWDGGVREEDEEGAPDGGRQEDRPSEHPRIHSLD